MRGRPRKPYLLFRAKRTGKIWYYRLGNEPHNVSHSTGETDRLKAEAVVAEKAHLQLPQTVHNRMVFSEWIRDFFVWGKCPHAKRLLAENKTITERYCNNQRRLVENYIQDVPWAGKPLADVTANDMIEWRDGLVGRMSPGTLNDTVSAMKTIWGEAIKRGLVVTNPSKAVSLAKLEEPQPGIIGMDRIKQLFRENWKDPFPWQNFTVYGVFLMAATTGMRKSEILALKWKNVHLLTTRIEVKEAFKNSQNTIIGLPKHNRVRKVPVPMPQQLVEFLTWYKAKQKHCSAEDFVFNYGGEPLRTVAWDNGWRVALRQLSWTDWARKNNVKPHSFRHSLCSELYAEGVSEQYLRMTFGWSPNGKTMEKSYLHILERSLSNQAAIVDQWFGKKPSVSQTEVMQLLDKVEADLNEEIIPADGFTDLIAKVKALDTETRDKFLESLFKRILKPGTVVEYSGKLGAVAKLRPRRIASHRQTG